MAQVLVLGRLALLTMDDNPWAVIQELEVAKGRAAQVVAAIGDIEHQLLRVKDKEKLLKCA